MKLTNKFTHHHNTPPQDKCSECFSANHGRCLLAVQAAEIGNEEAFQKKLASGTFKHRDAAVAERCGGKWCRCLRYVDWTLSNEGDGGCDRSLSAAPQTFILKHICTYAHSLPRICNACSIGESTDRCKARNEVLIPSDMMNHFNPGAKAVFVGEIISLYLDSCAYTDRLKFKAYHETVEGKAAVVDEAG